MDPSLPAENGNQKWLDSCSSAEVLYIRQSMTEHFIEVKSAGTSGSSAGLSWLLRRICATIPVEKMGVTCWQGKAEAKAQTEVLQEKENTNDNTNG